MHLALNMEEI